MAVSSPTVPAEATSSSLAAAEVNQVGVEAVLTPSAMRPFKVAKPLAQSAQPHATAAPQTSAAQPAPPAGPGADTRSPWRDALNAVVERAHRLRQDPFKLKDAAVLTLPSPVSNRHGGCVLVLLLLARWKLRLVPSLNRDYVLVETSASVCGRIDASEMRKVLAAPALQGTYNRPPSMIASELDDLVAAYRDQEERHRCEGLRLITFRRMCLQQACNNGRADLMSELGGLGMSE